MAMISKTVLAMVVALAALPIGGALAADTPPPGAKPVAATELLALYGGKTWVWPSGGGYFAPDRSFLGWAEADGVKTFARGRWKITDSGRMCFDANWRTNGKDYPAISCFLHVESGGDIYQRGTADTAEWYIFKHAKVEAGDEFSKLVPGDKVSAIFAEAEKKEASQ